MTKAEADSKQAAGKSISGRKTRKQKRSKGRRKSSGVGGKVGRRVWGAARRTNEASERARERARGVATK